MKALDKNYTMETGRLEAQSWHKVMRQFEDANLYQTSSYDMVGSGSKNFSHLILRKGNEIVAAAQARLMQLPVIKTGIAYVFWGPMWRKNGNPPDPEIFRQTIRSLRNEFSMHRGLVLRIYPLTYRNEEGSLESIFQEEGYHGYYDQATVKRTLLIDMRPSLEEIRSDLAQKWRNCLNRAEKNGMELNVSDADSFFDEIKPIYSEMIDRKNLDELNNLDHLQKVQKHLPPDFKMKIILCKQNDELCAGGIFSAIGSTGVYLVGATSNKGMKTNGSYMVQWAFIRWLKENGFLFYDLNGINPDSNPGTYHFKRGLAGKLGKEVEFLGKFQVSDNRLSSFVVNSGEALLPKFRKILGFIRSLHSSKE